MPLLEKDEFYHIYNRGNDKQRIFFERDNYLYFLRKLNHINNYVDILSWCLMPNHFHILVYVSNPVNNYQINIKFGTMLSSYSQAINKNLNRTGSLFQQRTKFKKIASEEYALVCFNYIHQNPMKAGLVDKMENYEFSSFKDYTGFRQGKLINKELALEILKLPALPNEIYDLSYQLLPASKVSKIL